MSVEMATREVRIVLVSPHELPRLGMMRLLESLDHVVVVAHAPGPEGGVRLAEEYKPDVVVVDGEVASLDGMRAIADLKAQLDANRALSSSLDFDPAPARHA